MKLTNVLGLPQPLYDRVARPSYAKKENSFSVTGLLRPPRLAVLERLHDGEMVEDASDRLWAMFGTIVHEILSKAETTGVSEQRYAITVTVDGVDYRVSGQIDRYENGIIDDYKFVTVWKAMELDPEYEKQVNMYSHLMRANGHEVKGLNMILMLRDWSKMKARRERDYPQKQVVRMKVPVWDDEKAKAFILERVRLHVAARTNLPECTDEERWAKDPVWAVMKKDRKRAVKLHSHPQLAQAHAEDLGKGHSVVYRPGDSVRCKDYCNASLFCIQWKTIKAAHETKRSWTTSTLGDHCHERP